MLYWPGGQVELVDTIVSVRVERRIACALHVNRVPADGSELVTPGEC